MFIRVPNVLTKFGIPKSTLFKSIHENRIRSIRIYRQYYVYWPDVRQHLIHQVIPNLLWWSTIKLPTPLPDGTVEANTVISLLNISRRQWQTQLRPILSDCGCMEQYTWNEIDAAVTTLRNQAIDQYQSLRNLLKQYDAVYQSVPARQVVFMMSVDGEDSYVLAEPPRTYEDEEKTP